MDPDTSLSLLLLPFCRVGFYHGVVVLQFSTPEIAAAAAELGVTAAEIQRCAQYPDPTECRRQLVSLQARLKKNFKQCARELHPDRTGNDPEKTARFAQIAKLWAVIKKMEIVVRPPAPVVRIVTMPSGGMYVSNNDTSTSTTTAWGGWQTWSPTR